MFTPEQYEAYKKRVLPMVSYMYNIKNGEHSSTV